ncbi:MAG: HAD-IIIA family hydrolase [archaeon]
MKKQSELVLMVGIPGCGKSTFRERFLPYHYPINLDSIHNFLAQGKGFDRKNLTLGRDLERIMIEDRLSQNIPTVVDNTNINVEKRQKYFEWAKEYGAQVIAVNFTPNAKTAIAQNNQRERRVPEVAIRKMLKDYQAPTASEGFEKIIDAANPIGLTGTKPAIFLDRDGVIFVTHIDGKSYFVNKPEEIRYLPKVFDGLRALSAKGYGMYLVSNQGPVGLGKLSEEELGRIHAKMLDDFKAEGVSLSGIYCCIHAPKDGCVCRKPSTGLIILAAREHNLDVAKSFMIGDMTSDIALGRRLKMSTILLETGYGGKDGKFDVNSTYLAKDLLVASSFIN